MIRGYLIASKIRTSKWSIGKLVAGPSCSGLTDSADTRMQHAWPSWVKKYITHIIWVR